RLVDPKQVRVAVQKRDRLVIALQLICEGCDVIVECSRVRRNRLPTRNEGAKVTGLGRGRPIVLKSRISLRHQDETTASVGLGFGKSCTHPGDIGSLTLA